MTNNDLNNITVNNKQEYNPEQPTSLDDTDAEINLALEKNKRKIQQTQVVESVRTSDLDQV